VRAAVSLAERRLRRERPAASDPLPGAAMRVNEQDVKPGEWKPDRYGMPPECPVQPLGMEGEILFVMDAMGQLRSCEPGKMGQKWLQSCFGDRQDYLMWAWPRFSKEGAVDTFRAEQVAKSFYHAAARRGLFSAIDKVKGRGAWRASNGALLFHSGDALWRSDVRDRDGNLKELPTGFVGNMLYQARPPIYAPWPEPVDLKNNPARKLLQALRGWNWTRPQVDPVLMLGWIAAAMLGGALAWRPTVFAIGDKAVGKSTLQDLIKGVFGDGLLSTSDTTEAGIFQLLKQDTLPVAVDELEAEADNRKVMAVVHLARLAASGAQRFRGGADHVGSQFRAQSSFFFSSINPPPLKPQDVSRMAIIRAKRLDPKKSGDAPPTIDADTCGPMLLRRLMDEWSRFDLAFAAYRGVLRDAGHDGRAQDTLGTLLACADLALGAELAEELDVPMVDDIAKWGDWLAPSKILEYEDNSENWKNCLTHLLTARVDAWRAGRQQSIGAMLDYLRSETYNGSEDEMNAVKRARADLAQAGVGLLLPGEIGPDYALAIPNEHPAVFALFKDTEFAGVPGASVWKSALRQGPDAVICTDPNINRVRIGGVQKRCALVRLDAFDRV
jgi:hypothetical protein